MNSQKEALSIRCYSPPKSTRSGIVQWSRVKTPIDSEVRQSFQPGPYGAGLEIVESYSVYAHTHALVRSALPPPKG